MKNLIFITLLAITLMLYGCTHSIENSFKGFYQNEQNVDGHSIQISIQPDDSSFVEYIDNREVDRGTYKKIENNVYEMNGINQNFEITLNNNKSFEVIIKKLNDGNPIQVKKIGNVPTYFETTFKDVDEYKSLLE